MLAKAIRQDHSFADYLRFENGARERHEFVGGLILAMAGGTPEHTRLATAIATAMAAQLRGRESVALQTNARVRVPATGNAYYPDATVVCGPPLRDPEDSLSVSNPAVLVEVLSPGTAEYDRTDKLADYQHIEPLQHIVHVAHDQPLIDVWTRTAHGWRCDSYGEGQTAALPAVGCELDVSELYRDTLTTG